MEDLPRLRGKGNKVMGLFGGNHNIYKDTEKGSSGKTPRPKPKSCGICHGTGKKLNASGRPMDKKCSSCRGSGMR
jgi:DnaJ-class molecular chaperone